MKSLTCTALADAIEAAAKASAPAAQTPSIAPGLPLVRLRTYAAHDPEASTVLADLMAEEEAPEDVTTLERVRRLIKRVERRALEAPNSRFSPLAGVLDRLYARERLLLGPPPAPPDAVQEELRRLDADAIAKIEEHLSDRIEPREVQ